MKRNGKSRVHKDIIYNRVLYKALMDMMVRFYISLSLSLSYFWADSVMKRIFRKWCKDLKWSINDF